MYEKKTKSKLYLSYTERPTHKKKKKTSRLDSKTLMIFNIVKQLNVEICFKKVS